jgi:hypothetical protein
MKATAHTSLHWPMRNRLASFWWYVHRGPCAQLSRLHSMQWHAFTATLCLPPPQASEAVRWNLLGLFDAQECRFHVSETQVRAWPSTRAVNPS